MDPLTARQFFLPHDFLIFTKSRKQHNVHILHSIFNEHIMLIIIIMPLGIDNITILKCQIVLSKQVYTAQLLKTRMALNSRRAIPHLTH